MEHTQGLENIFEYNVHSKAEGSSEINAMSLQAKSRIHINEEESYEMPLKCNICSKSFSHKSYLSEHICSHTGEK